MISNLFIYPIKSLGAISLQKSVLEKEGLQGDRRFMLVDNQGKFITQRTRPELTRFVLSATSSGFLVKDTASGLEKELAWYPLLGEKIEVEIWEDRLTAQEVQDGWSAWFSKALGEEVRLVRLTEENPREIKTKYQTQLVKNTSFADSLPILLIGAASYSALENQVGDKVDRLRFRPNIIVSTQDSFVEDNWSEIQIGETRLFGAKPCARCSLVNVDPHSGEANKKTLQALALIRTMNHKVYFGQQFVPIELGEIQVGDTIQILRSKDAIY